MNLILFILFFDMLERRFPKEYMNFVINVTYYFIYYYSKLQIILSKYANQFNILVESNSFLSNCKNEFQNILKKTDNITQYSIHDNFIIYNDTNSNKKKLYHSKLNLHNVKFIDSDYRFILLEFSVGVNKYKIDLNTDKFNFYVVENQFNRSFFMYYIKHYLKVDEIDNTEKICSLKIIDFDINRIEIELNDNIKSLLLEKDTYKIIDN